MRCILCDSNSWENVDEFRHCDKFKMSICTSCGFVSYPILYKEKEKVLEFYRKEYRPAPSSSNLFQGQRKLHYHHAFLYDSIIKPWHEQEKKNPVVFEIGAAYGLVLNWIKTFKIDNTLLFPEADVSGTELTESFKKNALHEFGITLEDDFNDSKKYDLIISYKVAEHMFDIDKELLRYRASLAEGGKLYISVPTWFKTLNNFGATGFSLEYYYSKNHVNVWTIHHFEALLKKCGLKIVKRNHTFYDDTYLCEPETDMKPQIEFSLPSVAQIKDWMRRIKEADEAVNEKDFEKAVTLWPDFPLARRALYEYKRKEWHKQGVEAIIKGIIEPWLAVSPNCFEGHLMWADILMRYDKHDKALDILKKMLEIKPKCEHATMGMVNCFRVLASKCADKEQKKKLLTHAKAAAEFCRQNHLSAFSQCTDAIYQINAEMP